MTHHTVLEAPTARTATRRLPRKALKLLSRQTPLFASTAVEHPPLLPQLQSIIREGCRLISNRQKHFSRDPASCKAKLPFDLRTRSRFAYPSMEATLTAQSQFNSLQEASHWNKAGHVHRFNLYRKGNFCTSQKLGVNSPVD